MTEANNNVNKEKKESDFNKEEWIQQKKEARTEAFEMLETATEELSSPDALTKYLDVQSRFDRYSVSNALLVSHQMPEATRLGDSKFWSKLGAYINKGEKGITILEPGSEFKREDGSTGVSYNAKKVFDASQTNSKHKTQKPKNYDEKKMVKALIKASPASIVFNNDLPDKVNARYEPDSGLISIRQGMSGKDVVKCLSVEIARAIEDNGKNNKSKNPLTAACVGYIVCKRMGVETPEIKSGGKLFDGMNPKEVRAELGKIRETANSISNVVSKVLEPKDKDAR